MEALRTSRLKESMMRSFALLLLMTSSALAQETLPTEPWKWTPEQRLAARFDKKLMAARVVEGKAQNGPGRARAMSNGAEATSQDFIIGRQHPELFLPTELFQGFI